MRFLAVLTVRNEGAFLLEWLAHHLAVGFTDFLVFSNDCQDGTDTMLDKLAELGYLIHLRNDGPHDQRGIQFTALKTASRHPLVKNADWILTLDVDEFMNIHAGDGTLPALLEALPDADAITLTWRLFGCSDKLRFEEKPVTETFLRAAPEVLNWPWRAAMFKTLYRNNGVYKKLGVHRPRSPDQDQVDTVRWFDGEGRELDKQFRTKRIFSNFGRPNYRHVQLKHYPLGAMESFVLKADRGRAVHSDHMLDVDYWVERNFNIETDETILRYQTDRQCNMETFLADQSLQDLHTSAVDWRRKRFTELMQDEPYRALFARLMMTPPTRPLNAKTAQTLMSFANLGRQKAQQGTD